MAGVNEQLVKSRYALVIIGAGPAGMCAAVIAAQQGIDTLLLDEQKIPGGQIYRSMETVPTERAQLLGAEYQRGRKLVKELRDAGIAYLPESRVWMLNHKLEIGLLHNDGTHIIRADRVILASGAMERPAPFPGWTLPGVMYAGAGQILFKAHGIIPEDEVILAGSGPLLLLLAWQYMHAGVKISALLDLTPMRNHLRALPYLPRALLARHYLLKGLAYKKDLRQAGISTLHNVSEMRANGEQQLESISFRQHGKQHTMAARLLLTHFGVIPHINLSHAAGCKHRWDNSQQCWRPVVDAWGTSSNSGILITGDGAAIGGARTAEHAGRLAGLQAACTLGMISPRQRDKLARQDRKWMAEERHIRPFLEAFFHIPGKLLDVPDDATIVCRCEEITAGEIRNAVAAGHKSSNQVKFLTRCGMGPCQGRQCAMAVAHIVASTVKQDMTQVGIFRARPPVVPLTLGELASLGNRAQE